MIIKFYVAEEIVLRQEFEKSFRDSFVAEFVEVPRFKEKFFVVVRRIEGVGYIQHGKIF